MKKIAFITDGWERYVTYAWIQGYRRYMAEHPLTADLYVFHSFGNFSNFGNFSQDPNTGEYSWTPPRSQGEGPFWILQTF